MFCEKCGEWNEDELGVCKFCGERIADEEEYKEGNNKTQAVDNSIRSIGRSYLVERWILSIVIAAASLFCGLSVLFDFTGVKFSCESDVEKSECKQYTAVIYKGSDIASGKIGRLYEQEKTSLDDSLDYDSSYYYNSGYSDYSEYGNYKKIGNHILDSINSERVFIIIFIILSIVLVMFEIIMLSALRNRVGYILVGVSAALKLLFVIIMSIVWNANMSYITKIVNKEYEIYDSDLYFNYSGYICGGRYAAIISQAVVIVCAVILAKHSRKMKKSHSNYKRAPQMI